MSLPNSYSGKIHFPINEKTDWQQFSTSLETQLDSDPLIKEFVINDDLIQFTHQSIFRIQYNVDIQVSPKNLHSVDYEIKLNKLIQICVVLIIFIALFSSFTFTAFLWFSFIFTIVFYAVNIMVIDKYVQNIINSAVRNGKSLEMNEEILSKEQLEWIKDNSKCPACGENITEYDKNCPECGIKLREKVPQTPFNASKYKKKRITYYFKEKRKE
jgi:hypothetical protein